VTVELKREDPRLLVFVRDDGAGLPGGFALESGSNLGLQIVRTLLIELAGEIRLTSNGGTTVELSIPLQRD
jgi:two-component sensor histidine kinase